LTLLNTDLKILAPVLAKRLESCLPNIIHPGQHCGLMGRTILDATATVRDAIAYAEPHNKKLCILSLDFKDAFDNISHTYLYEILKGHGFNEGFIDQIRTIYAGAMASVQINGHLSNTFPIQRGIRQGCPLA
jgi:hypothetical protein